jgi:hypothetical protein
MPRAVLLRRPIGGSAAVFQTPTIEPSARPRPPGPNAQAGKFRRELSTPWRTQAGLGLDPAARDVLASPDIRFDGLVPGRASEMGCHDRVE